MKALELSQHFAVCVNYYKYSGSKMQREFENTTKVCINTISQLLQLKCDRRFYVPDQVVLLCYEVQIFT